MAGSVLALLAEQGSLGYEQIATMLDEPPDTVRRELEQLRAVGLVVTSTGSAWRLTGAGAELVGPAG